MSVTIKEIAALSGVGISTVSRVINNTATVSEELRKKVLQVIAEQNYVPNSSAQALKRVDSKTIALLVKGITNPLFGKMIRVIEHETALRGYVLAIQNIDAMTSEMDVAIAMAQDKGLCGVILMGGYFSYTEEKFLRLGIPCVLLTVAAENDISPELFSSVIINDELAGYTATRHLIELGHRRIGFIFHSVADTDTPNGRRFLGYRRAMDEAGIPDDSSLYDLGITTEDTGYESGYNMMKRLCVQNPDITAVFAFSDVLAVGAAKAALASGRRIPEDISIIGFDGIEISEYFHPSLDTFYQPSKQMALSAIEALFDMMQGRKARHITYDAVLLKRGSCKER